MEITVYRIASPYTTTIRRTTPSFTNYHRHIKVPDRHIYKTNNSPISSSLTFFTTPLSPQQGKETDKHQPTTTQTHKPQHPPSQQQKNKMDTTSSFTNPADANPTAAPPAPTKPKKMIKISNNDGPVHQISEDAARQSPIIMDCIGDMHLSEAAVIPIFMDVSEAVLTCYIIPFLEGQHDGYATRDDMIGAIPSCELTCEVLRGANYLGAEALLDAAARAVADRLMDLTTEELRALFGIENDLTPMEIAQLARDNEWTLTQWTLNRQP